jgi:hypothetical protein
MVFHFIISFGSHWITRRVINLVNFLFFIQYSIVLDIVLSGLGFEAREEATTKCGLSIEHDRGDSSVCNRNAQKHYLGFNCAYFAPDRRLRVISARVQVEALTTDVVSADKFHCFMLDLVAT